MNVGTDDDRENVVISVSMAEAMVLRDQLGDAPAKNAEKIMQLYRAIDSVLSVQPANARALVQARARDARAHTRARARPKPHSFEVIQGGKENPAKVEAEGGE